MEYKDFWGFTNENQAPVQDTKEIFKIMEHQCKMLLKHTDNNVFGVFSELKNEGSFAKALSIFATALKGTTGMAGTTETINGMSTNELIDAGDMLHKQRYAFEICNETYRFRVFTILIAPIFPVEMVINADIYKSIAGRIKGIVKLDDTEGSITIPNEDVFETVLQIILMDTKVHYIVTELEKQARATQENKDKPLSKVIICEGRIDEIILQSIAQKVNKQVSIVTANGNARNAEIFAQIFSAVRKKDDSTNILIVVDSDGDEAGVRDQIEGKLGREGYELVIVNNRIEDWFTPKVKNFGALKLMHSISAIIDVMDFDELYRKHDSFARVIDFLEK